MVSSAGQKGMALLDHTIVSIIVALQFLGCLLFIATLLLFSRYPGADFNALPKILFFAGGVAAAVILQTNQRTEYWRRVPALLWNVLFAAYVAFHRGANPSGSSSALSNYTVLFSLWAAIYLGVTAAIGYTGRRDVPEPTRKP